MTKLSRQSLLQISVTAALSEAKLAELSVVQTALDTLTQKQYDALEQLINDDASDQEIAQYADQQIARAAAMYSKLLELGPDDVEVHGKYSRNFEPEQAS